MSVFCFYWRRFRGAGFHPAVFIYMALKGRPRVEETGRAHQLSLSETLKFYLGPDFPTTIDYVRSQTDILFQSLTRNKEMADEHTGGVK